MEKTFTRAGTSVLNGVKAYRFANDAGRDKVLAKNGHTEIHFVDLERPLTKEAAIEVLNNEYGIFAENTKVTSKRAQGAAPKSTATRATQTPRKPKQADVIDDDGFVEPKDEAIQVAMCRKAREYPGLSARQLYDMVMLTVKEFGDTEPNF